MDSSLHCRRLYRRLFDRSAIGCAVFPFRANSFVRPLSAVLGADSRARATEAAEVSSWISSHSDPSDWVVTFPNVELLIWDYRRPTLTMPNDYEMLLWPCLEEHGVRFVVVDPDLPGLRPWRSE